MIADRERSVTEAFVSLANSLVGPFDVVELFNGLTEQCAQLLDVASARHATLYTRLFMS